MDDIGALLDETGVIFLIVCVDVVERWRLEQADITSKVVCQHLCENIEINSALIGISKPLHRLVPIADRTQDNLGIEVVRELGHKL